MSISFTISILFFLTVSSHGSIQLDHQIVSASSFLKVHVELVLVFCKPMGGFGTRGQVVDYVRSTSFDYREAISVVCSLLL
jgi:hypothetical protein